MKDKIKYVGYYDFTEYIKVQISATNKFQKIMIISNLLKGHH